MQVKANNWICAALRALETLALVAAVMWMLPMNASAASKALPSGGHAVKHRRVHRRYRRHHITLPKAPSKDRTEEIQSALQRDGYYNGDPSGKWDARTQTALRKFQEDNGLSPTGKLDALSLQKLGLGSDVAGVSAPKTVTSANGPGGPGSPLPKSPGR